MPKIILILGLCGSGKTYLADQLQKQTGARIFDEPIGRDQEPAIVEHLRSGCDCIVEELYYCTEFHRTRLLRMLQAVPRLDVEFICYDNDKESADWNVQHRGNKGRVSDHLRLNDQVSPHYTFPPNCQRRSIFRIKAGQ